MKRWWGSCMGAFLVLLMGERTSIFHSPHWRCDVRGGAISI